MENGGNKECLMDPSFGVGAHMYMRLHAGTSCWPVSLTGGFEAISSSSFRNGVFFRTPARPALSPPPSSCTLRHPPPTPHSHISYCLCPPPSIPIMLHASLIFFLLALCTPKISPSSALVLAWMDFWKASIEIEAHVYLQVYVHEMSLQDQRPRGFDYKHTVMWPCVTPTDRYNLGVFKQNSLFSEYLIFKCFFSFKSIACNRLQWEQFQALHGDPAPVFTEVKTPQMWLLSFLRSSLWRVSQRSRLCTDLTYFSY